MKEETPLKHYKREKSLKIKNINNNIQNNTYNNCTNKMTINVFLNEQCKDALNLTDFVENIKVTLEDLEYSKDNGFVNGVTNIIKKQLILKGIITEEDWDSWKEDIAVEYVRDSHFTELKEAELLRERLQTLDMMQQYVGEYHTKDWVMRNVLKFSEEDMKNMEQDVEDENKEKADEIDNIESDNE